MRRARHVVRDEAELGAFQEWSMSYIRNDQASVFFESLLDEAASSDGGVMSKALLDEDDVHAAIAFRISEVMAS